MRTEIATVLHHTSPECSTPPAGSPTFVPNMVSVFTWFAVAHPVRDGNLGNDLLNTFQAVLASGKQKRYS